MHQKRISIFLVFLVVLCMPALLFAGFCVDGTCTVECEEGIPCEGTPGQDWICGTKLADTISGLGGDDRICGGHGGDTINGGDGNDIIQGGWGIDFLYGDADADTIRGGQCDDTIDGGSESELACEGGQGSDSISNCEEIGDQGQTDSQTHDNCI